ncbi:hypothetical protein GMD78_19970 [Ornithinibacillus sp. L9]|uniref:Uncharacterized protein n=1 Tax=Ornithinibacillus caprae TaxID=2678566 RepID=A0A6N8FQK8_9BACI|nr:hypothetical protein [Ornithinibacillus caprae]MUK90637.1 hypothetical protein [Ornithinibacillus caprae]
MTRKSYVFHLIIGFIIGLFILPAVLDWFGIPFSFYDVLTLILGEPNTVNRIIVMILFVIFLFFSVRSFYKELKKLP